MRGYILTCVLIDTNCSHCLHCLNSFRATNDILLTLFTLFHHLWSKKAMPINIYNMADGSIALWALEQKGGCRVDWMDGWIPISLL